MADAVDLAEMKKLTDNMGAPLADYTMP